VSENLQAKFLTMATILVLVVLICAFFFLNYAGLSMVHQLPVPNGLEIIKNESKEEPRRWRHLVHLEGEISENAARSYYQQEMVARGWSLDQVTDSGLTFNKEGVRLRLNLHPEGHRLLLIANIIERKSKKEAASQK